MARKSTSLTKSTKSKPRSKSTKQQFTTYSNLTKNRGKSRRAIKKDGKKRAHAEYLATLPKNPFLRFLAHFHPKRVLKYWFSMRGLKMIGKIVGITVLVLVLTAGALFMYFRKELESLRPEELMKRVATTVTRYYDRNCDLNELAKNDKACEKNLIWEDTGTGDYRLVVDSEQISQFMKDATVAIEDHEFYKHGGVSLQGMLRAVINNVRGSGSTQGGSTLTQQLIKQVFFKEEAAERGIKGIPRKIKEAILSVEAERIYTKDQILTMYLNESPYGGRRNGVESAAQTYFGHSAKELTLAESALLAAIPQSPSVYNPYNTDWNKSLLERQRYTLDMMRRYMPDKYSKEAIDEAKNVPILDTIKPAESLLKGAKAPHFVQMVKQDLEKKLGTKVVGQGGLIVKTTLDLRVQKLIDTEVKNLFNSGVPYQYGFDNTAVTMLDNQTGQILGLSGSRDYNFPGYGAVNSATASIQPGSTIKPLVYAALIDNKDGPNGTFGAGSLIADAPIPQSIYTTGTGRSVVNADGRFKGNLSIRTSLGESRNIPAIRAMAMNGIDATKDKIREIGNKSYCTEGVEKSAGLASAIGSCGVKQVEHANAFATLARMGTYKEISDVLEVRNTQKQIVYEWEDDGKQVLDPQTAYIISDILGDMGAKRGTFGSLLDGVHYMTGGVKTAIKTGTSDIGGLKKDLWMVGYTPKATLAIWWGNHVPKALRSGSSYNISAMMRSIMMPAHNDIFKADGTWAPNAWFTRPAGIQWLNINGRTDIYPSWYNKNTSKITLEKMTFDKVSKKLATECTPPGAREELDVIKNIDPLTKQIIYTPPNGYDAEKKDDVHHCGTDQKPFVSLIGTSLLSGNEHYIYAIIQPGTHPITNVTISFNGESYKATQYALNDWRIIVDTIPGTYSARAVATDKVYYTGEGSNSVIIN
ncbi:MAG: penicillin-binding protein [Candidatus Nomurabacteria bacterium]|jgi:penicillin-binding protein 1A|nr:penicillin-binding protein [Candidatus Nomurabacteria bacterium]